MNKRGLTSERAKELLETYGKNELKETNKRGPLKILLHQVKGDVMIYLLLVAMALSLFIGEPITAYTILAVILIIIITGFIQEYKAEKVIESLKKMVIPVSIVLRDGKEKEIQTNELVPGDIVLLEAGEKIPADCLIIEQNELLVDESILTGESKEISKIVTKDKEKYSEENLIYMGSFVVNGKCLAKVIHTGMDTKFGKIAGMISRVEKNLPLQEKTNQISKTMVIIAIVFSLATGILMCIGRPLSTRLLVEAATIVIALSVSAFPESLPVALTTALSRGAYVMAKKNAVVNRMSIIETLGETTVICSDKTGTITKGEMTVKRIVVDGRIYEVGGTGYEAKGDFFLDGEKIDPNRNSVLKRLLVGGANCNDALIETNNEKDLFNILGSPTEAAILVAASKTNLPSTELNQKRLAEIPFSSERKIMTVMVSNSRERIIYSKGAPEYILENCTHIQRKNGIFRLTKREKETILKNNFELTSNALRTIAVAYKKPRAREKISEDRLIFLGILGMEDPPKDEVTRAIQICLNAGISVKMITGDNKETAISIGKQIGIEGKILLGEDLEKITDEQLSEIVTDIKIFARVKPEHKLKIVRALKLRGEIVTMTGDGVNDAPALKEAHVGVAMGMAGTDVSREVADLVIKDDNFATIVDAIKEGRTIFKSIRKFIIYLLSCNYAELAILFIGVILAPLLGWQAPLLLALQILFMNLVTDEFPAISLTFTPPSENIMAEKPRKNKKILNRAHWIWIVIGGVCMAVMTLLVYFIVFNVLGKSTVEARTTALLTLILLEIGGAYNFLSFKKEVGRGTWKTNKYLLGAAALSIIATLMIIYTPLNKVFGTIPLEVLDWIVSLGFMFTFIIIFNLLKRWNNDREVLKLN